MKMNIKHIPYIISTALAATLMYMMYQPQTYEKAITIEDPTSAEDISLWYNDDVVIFKQIADVVQGTTPSVTWNIEYASTRNGVSRTTVFSSDRVTTSESGATTTTFNADTIPADQWIFLTTSAQSGTVDELSVTIRYEVR